MRALRGLSGPGFRSPLKSRPSPSALRPLRASSRRSTAKSVKGPKLGDFGRASGGSLTVKGEPVEMPCASSLHMAAHDRPWGPPSLPKLKKILLATLRGQRWHSKPKQPRSPRAPLNASFQKPQRKQPKQNTRKFLSSGSWEAPAAPAPRAVHGPPFPRTWRRGYSGIQVSNCGGSHFLFSKIYRGWRGFSAVSSVGVWFRGKFK